MSDRLKQLATDLDELVSRGTNHPDGDLIAGRMRVTIQQATDDAAGTTPPPADPVQDQLAKIHAEIEGMHMLVEAAINAKH